MTLDSALTQRTKRVNPFAMIALACGLLSLTNFIVGGFATTAVFAVGAGHIALQQIARRGDRGQVIAVIGLVTGYAIGAYALASSVYFWITLGLQNF